MYCVSVYRIRILLFNSIDCISLNGIKKTFASYNEVSILYMHEFTFTSINLFTDSFIYAEMPIK